METKPKSGASQEELNEVRRLVDVVKKYEAELKALEKDFRVAEETVRKNFEVERQRITRNKSIADARLETYVKEHSGE